MFLSISLGMAVSTLLKIKLTLEERICFSILVGHAVSTTIVYLISYLRGGLDLPDIGIGILLITVSTIIVMARREVSVKDLIIFDVERVFVIFFGLLAFLFLNLQCVLKEASDSLYGSSFVIGDYCFHISVINSFAYRNNFPPQYPVMVNFPMAYPPLVDFLSSMLMKTGFDLRSSMIIPNIFFQVSLLCWIASLAIRITGRKGVGMLSALLFFFSSNLGILYAFNDIAKYGFINWIANLPMDYSGSGVSSLPGIRFGNPVTVMIMPQRSSSLGIGISLIIYTLIFYTIITRDGFRELLLAGFLTGLLPSIHPHSFLAVSIVFFLTSILFRKDLKFFTCFFTPAIFLVLPQILVISRQIGTGFFGVSIGWLEENTIKILSLNWANPAEIPASLLKSVSLLIVFWFMNIGFILIPFSFGFLKSNSLLRKILSPYLMIFLLGNFVRFQPWDWDNYKIFLHCHILTIIIASFGILELSNILNNYLRQRSNFFKSRLIAVLGFACLATILFFSTASGLLSHIRVFQESYLMWPKSDILFAEWIRENTPPESVFLTSTHFLNPVVTLAGRQVVLGYEGWLWSHGLDWAYIQKVKNEVIEMFRGNHTLMKRYHVDYVVLTRYEYLFAIDNGFAINIEPFNDSRMFEKVYDETIDGNRYLVFKVL